MAFCVGWKSWFMYYFLVGVYCIFFDYLTGVFVFKLSEILSVYYLITLPQISSILLVVILFFINVLNSR